ncbi:MAG: hypothetical protein E7455_06395, partial [Ruminococcaceae bacterium]|nr:hypothetical protein [Oscillospiraceae bacterium]
MIYNRQKLTRRIAMKNSLKRISAGLLALILVLSLIFTGIPTDVFATSITYSTSYNSGTRDEICTTLDGTGASDYYTSSYTYDVLSEQSSTQLLQSLRTLMTNTHTYRSSYDDCKNYANRTDCENEDGRVLLLYTSYSATMSQWNGWNREHVWPQSLGGGNTSGGGADLHHIRPSDAGVNSSRGNKKYGDSNNETAKYGSNPATGYLGGYYNSTYFEPLDNVKGDVARICLYVYVRWGSSWGADSITEVFQSVDVLLEWMELDPVDTWEMGRNEVVEDIQGNRNVFIDYPEYAWLLFGEEVPEDLTTPSNNGGSSSGSTTCTHSWIAATCTAAKTCSKCGATEGAALGHTWQAATCLAPKTCSVCKTTEGSVGSHIDANSDNSCDVCGTSLGGTVVPQNGKTYVKVTSAPGDWSGQYLIVYENGSLAFDGSLTKLDAASNTISVTITDGVIVLDEDESDSYFLIEAVSGGYSIRSASGSYIGRDSNANGLDSGTSALANTLSVASDGSVNIIGSAGAYLRFNKTSGQMRFRYYKTSSYAGQQPVALYKLVEEVHEHEYTAKVTTEPTCTAAGVKTYTCECGDSYTETIAALGHSYKAVVTAPTCTAAGYTTYTCATCGNSYTADNVAALGHTAAAAVKEN